MRRIASRAVVCASLLALAGCAGARPAAERPSDWLSHEVCGPDTRPAFAGRTSCVEVIELRQEPRARRAVALLVPGMFQNAASFDLWPERGISFARYLVERGVKVYFLHVRGMGRAPAPAASTLDDIAIEDVPRGLAFVAARERSDVIGIGQSQGSIALQGALAGITRCGARTCFDPAVAAERQRQIRALGLFTGSVAFEPRPGALSLVGTLGASLSGAAAGLLERIPGRDPGVAFFGLAGPAPYDFLIRPENVPPEVIEAMLERSVESALPGVARQLAEGVAAGSIRSGSERWIDHLRNVRVHVVQTTFGADPLAPPAVTYARSFRRLGSPTKRFVAWTGQAHEDFLSSPALHRLHGRTVEELIRPPTAL